MLDLYTSVRRRKGDRRIESFPWRCGGLRSPLGAEKTGWILANIKTTPETEPFILKKTLFSSAVVSLALKFFHKTSLTIFSYETTADLNLDLNTTEKTFVRHFATGNGTSLDNKTNAEAQTSSSKKNISLQTILT